MKVIINKLITLCTTCIILLALSGCANEAASPSDDYGYLEIKLEGTVSYLDEEDEKIPLSGVRVVLMDAEQRRVDSKYTNEYGKFFIHKESVYVGDYYDRHIYVEIVEYTDVNNPDLSFQAEVIRKDIKITDGNVATLTLKDILLSPKS